jgi:hypothetical protein
MHVICVSRCVGSCMQEAASRKLRQTGEGQGRPLRRTPLAAVSDARGHTHARGARRNRSDFQPVR